jgi:predicted lipid-binding transport protein (Tim44 family)
VTPIGRGDGADRATRELLDPQYAHEALLDRLYRYFNQFLGDLMDGVAGGGTAGGIIAAVIIVLILVAVATLVGWQLRKTGRRNAMTAGALFGARATTAAEHRQRAEQLASEGHWSAAVQERLRAIARDLEERALVDGMPGRTADELAAEAGAALPGFAAELTAAARSFDDVTYGGVAGTRDAYETMTALDERLRLARPVPMGGPA